MSQISEQADNHKEEEVLIPANLWNKEVLIDAKLIENNLLEIKESIAPCKPKIIGVTKYFGLDAIVKGYQAGLRDFGESRVADAIQKIDCLPSEIKKDAKFHFIGHLQTNKAEKVVKYFDYIHSIDSLKLASIVSNTACRLNKREKVLLQVNIANEEQKFGYQKNELKKDFQEILKLEGLEVIGLMCMAPLQADFNELRDIFGSLRNFRDELENDYGVELPELSMGMSNDYKLAVAEGATMIRIGRKLFK